MPNAERKHTNMPGRAHRTVDESVYLGSPENPGKGDYCITQIVSRYNEIADGVLRYIFNRGCVEDNIEDPGNNPFGMTRNEGRDVVRTMSEDWVCDSSFCNVGLEDQRECFECSDFVEDGEELSSSE